MSEFWVRKVRTYFAVLDVNGDGFISKKDLEDMANGISDVEKSSPEQRAETVNNFVVVWRKLMKSAGSDDNGLLTASIAVASIDQQKNDPEFKEAFLKMFQELFRMGDTTGDGYLSKEEYVSLYAGVGAKDTSFLDSAFESLDLNEDGKLNLTEFSEALVEYLTTEDKRLLWGPLV